ncbi:MAG: hypothetical protein ABIE68_02150 [bacterium]
MVETINEPINVVASFANGKVRPRKFVWGRRVYPVEAIHLIHRSRKGRAELYFFSVSDGVNVFKLLFNNETLDWVLEEVYI